ncbi:hypothetical protein ACEQ8H_004967 [Pleosporales sp. CAS-2024a]
MTQTASAFVVQDPKQLTKHGKSKTAPVIYAFEDSAKTSLSSVSTPSDLHVTTVREAENGRSFFQTLAPMSRRKTASSRKTAAQQRKKLAFYLQHLQAEAALSAIRPLSPETTLIARYVDMLGPEDFGSQPLSILGTWVQTIPSRIGANRMMDLAIDFFIHSYAVFQDDTYSKRTVASATKEKALKELQLFVLDTDNKPTYEVILATKMHYAAEALLGIDTMHHAIHAFGLTELLKNGQVSKADDEHFWNLIDNTYIDDVNEAMLGDRDSVYDNEHYLSATYPPPLNAQSIVLSPSQRASMVMMHVFIQCPRLNRLVRHAVANKHDTSAIVTAMTLAESLWQVNIASHVAPLLTEAISLSSQPVPGLSDILVNSLHFSSIQSMMLCTRYWMLITIQGGLINMLYEQFPAETGLSLLPDRYALHKLETDAATKLAMSIPWADSLSHKLPLVPLRLHTPLQISIGPWQRTIQRLTAFRASSQNLHAGAELEISRTIAHADRMKVWIINECNRIHEQWDVSIIAEGPLLEALDTMAGGKIPDWLPVRVRFEAGDGEMVMKLDYENKAGSYRDSFELSDVQPKRHWESRSRNWAETAGMAVGMSGKAQPYKSELDPTLWFKQDDKQSMEPRSVADFVHSTGRNLCSTSGWWPTDDDDDTCSEPSAFSNMQFPSPAPSKTETSQIYGPPYLASRSWPQISNSTILSMDSGAPKNPCLSPAWANPLSQTSSMTIRNGKKTPVIPHAV